MREKKEIVEAKCKDVEYKKDQLKELGKLRAVFEAQKKELEELRVGFTTEKKELEEDCQKQINKMFFFGYQCCMRKNVITQDIPNYFSDKEDAIVSSPTQGDKDPNAVGLSDGQ